MRTSYYEPTERDIRKSIYRFLDKIGKEYRATSAPRKTSNTRGTADIFIHASGDKWLAIEVKSESGKLSPEQQRDADAGIIHIARSVDDVLKILQLHS